MATPKVKENLSSNWSDVAKSAASVAGVTWQNVGPGDCVISFTTAEPTSADAYHVLKSGEAYYDKNGSAHVWARYTGGDGATITATAD